MFTQVAEGIHKLVVRFPGGMEEVNCYFFAGEKGYTVVDTGTYSEEAISTWQQVIASGITIDKIVLTHTHQDHIGMAKWLRDRLGVPVIVSDLGYQEMQDFQANDINARLKHLLRKHGAAALITERPDDSFIYDFEPDGIYHNQAYIRLGDRDYEAIWTPGHAPDHFCFYQPETQIMIVGDHILQHVSPVIGLWAGREENPLRAYYDALQTLNHYPTDIALPGHGEMIHHLQERAQHIKKRHDQRLSQALEIIQTGEKTAYHVCSEVYGEMDKRLALSSFMATLTRLLYLESIGEIEQVERDEEVMFQPTSNCHRVKGPYQAPNVTT